jgi:outer membrane protein OmpA-like peptidoglycan-associated protein
LPYFLVNYDWQSTFASTDEVDSTQVEQVTGAEIDTTALPKDTAVAKIDSSNTAAEVKLTGIALPNGQTIETLPGSFVERFTKYVADTASRPSQVFVLENVAFEGNTANLVTGGEKNIQDLAKIMTAYPKVQVKITSHTDNTGDTLQNKTMSRKRAFAIRNMLVTNGISAIRIDFDGKGPFVPVASNTTEEGKAKIEELR